MDTRGRLTEAFDIVSAWADAQENGAPHPSTPVDVEPFGPHFAAMADQLWGNRPFVHPAYAGRLLKPPHRAAVVGHLATVLVDPDNRALDGGPTTSALEEEVIADLAAMFGLPEWLGHLTSGGTVGNLEALWVARESHPELGIAHSADRYPIHQRMCGVLRTPSHSVPVDAAGRMDPDALATVLHRERVGTVVVTVGTTSLGAVDPVADVLALCREHDVRVHVDAAYGGFFTLLTDADELRDTPVARHLRAIADCDSVVVDPHQLGLQSHDCGAVLFRDPAVGGDSRPEAKAAALAVKALRPGEIGFECARPGAAAAALWLTLRALPLTPDGLGGVLAAGLRAARRWRELMDGEPELMLYQDPELDILTYLALTGEPRPRLSSVEAASRHIVHAGVHSVEHPVQLSALPVRVLDFLGRHPLAVADQKQTHVLRSVLTQPESETHVDLLHERVTALAAAAPR